MRLPLVLANVFVVSHVHISSYYVRLHSLRQYNVVYIRFLVIFVIILQVAEDFEDHSLVVVSDVYIEYACDSSTTAPEPVSAQVRNTESWRAFVRDFLDVSVRVQISEKSSSRHLLLVHRSQCAKIWLL